MDETVYKIALAAFFHDIGKFAERADMNVSPEFLNSNAGLYQPYNKQQNSHTHKHAVYTAAFIDHIEKLLPAEFNKAGWGLGDSFTNLTAGHHNPQTPLQWIVAMADRVSSGFDRQEFDDYNNGIGVRDYKKTRLLSLFEGLSINDAWKNESLDSYAYRYPLAELSPENIFPQSRGDLLSIDNEEASREYSELFFGFVDALEKLEHKQSIPLWFEHFDSLFLIYVSHVPAATVGKVVPDVSLYDHSKLTAALATAIYRYHEAMGTLEIDGIRDYDDQKFLLVSGDFYGIQDFIFAEGGSTGKAAAKLLRGRSFAVSLISELAADMLCRELGLPTSSVVLNAAGKFTILAPNLEFMRAVIKEVHNAINEWLLGNYYGQASLGICTVAASCKDFVGGNFPRLWEELQSAGERVKFSKLDLERDGGVVSGYLDSFNNSLDHPLCPFCGKRPSHPEAYVGNERECSCKICRDHNYIGEHLVKQERIAVTTVDADLRGEKLLEPIFGRYQVSFDVGGKLGDLARSGTLLKYWDIGIPEDGKIAKNITAKFINGYVPKYSEEDNFDDRFLQGKKKADTMLELVEALKPGMEIPKTFLHIAKTALNFTDKPGKFTGIEALAVVKADVDNLGLVFSCGIRHERFTISRLATLSRQMNNFFAVYLPHILKTTPKFANIYTIFAGGDDLFLVGPWNRVIDFARFLKEKLTEYVCGNPDITISAGVSIHKPGEPIRTISETAENSLEASKARKDDSPGNDGGKDAVTIFGETVAWKDFARLQDIRDALEAWYTDGTVNNAMLFRLNELTEMAKQEKEIRQSITDVSIDDMECLKWRSRLKYTVVRNTGRQKKGDDKSKIIDEVLETLVWLDEFGGAMKIPLWQIIYNHR
jgi:CRISPR-associated protein Csm1